MPPKKKSSAPTAEDLVRANEEKMLELQEMRAELESLKHQTAEDTAYVQAELHAAQLAEEQDRLERALEFERARVGVQQIREAAPELSSQADERTRLEAEALAELQSKAAAAVADHAGIIPTGEDN